VKADHILNPTVIDIEMQSLAQRQDYYLKLNRWIAEADIVVCEISYPSTLNIGHEVSLALGRGKPTIALYQKGREPGVLQGISNEKLISLEYSMTDLKNVLSYGIEESKHQIDARFTLLFPRNIVEYLDEISNTIGTSRSEHIRELLLKEMKKNKQMRKKKI